MLSNLNYSKLRLPLLLAVALFSTSAIAAGDIERGRVAADTCKGCHAVDSYTNVYPTYHVPRVAGQSQEYLVAALTLFREGNRKHSTMTAQAASLSDQDIQDIAAYWSSIKTLSATAEAKGTAPEAAAVCAACHGAAGVSAIPMNPHLAGQHKDYLEQAILQYKNGERKGPNAIAMQAQVNAVADEDLAAIVAFFASQDGLTAVPE